MINQKIIFGTDGWRGKLDKEINENSVSVVAQAFADYLKIRNRSNLIKVSIGYDGRKNSLKFAEIFAEVLSGNSIEVLLSDKLIPTPVLSFSVKKLKLNAGVMITASHNPREYNGVKFKDYYGGPFFTEDTLKIENLLYKNPVVKADKFHKCDLLSPYLEHIKSYVNLEIIKNKRIKILFDSMSGAGQTILENFLLDYGIESSTIFGKADTNFSGRLAEPIEKNLLPLKETIKINDSFSFGAATDGDADRIGIILDNGEWLSAQLTILLLTDYIVNQKKINGHIVKTSSVTDKIKFFESSSRKIFDVQVGFKYICEKMIEEEIAIGCEESGGYGFANHIPERDGLLSSLLIAEMLASSEYFKLSDYLKSKEEQFGKIFYNRIDFNYEKDDRLNKLPLLSEHIPLKISSFNVTSIKTFFSSRNIINGIKFYLEGKNRWLLLRSSETEPMFRIYAEGDSAEEVQAILNSGKNILTSNVK